jgi:adenylate kinase family enzyme
MQLNLVGNTMRVSIVGTSGAGKTTLAKTIAAQLGCKRIELDAINWRDGTRDLQRDDPEEFKKLVVATVNDDVWVCDGNYALVRPMVLARATHLIWLDYSRPVVMSRVIRRSLGRALSREALLVGNHESFGRWIEPEHPVRWAWETFYRRRAEYEALVADPANRHLRVIRIGRPREIDKIASQLAEAA